MERRSDTGGRSTLNAFPQWTLALACKYANMHTEVSPSLNVIALCSSLLLCPIIRGGSECSMHIILQPCLPVRPACCHAVSGMASSVGSHIRPTAVGSVPVSHSRHTSQSSTDTQLDNDKTHSRAGRLQRVFTASARTKDDFLTSWLSLCY